MSEYVLEDFCWLRDMRPPEALTEDTESDPYALISVVNMKPEAVDQLDEETLTQAYTDALLALFSSRDESVRAALQMWISGRIRKITKRAKNSAWQLTAANADFVGQRGGQQVAVFAPMRLSEQPEFLRKLQVSGLTVPYIKNGQAGLPKLTITVDERLRMSSGKTLAQSGHAVQLFLARADPSKVEKWLEAGSPVRLEKASSLSASNADVIIQDAGLTEIPPGSITCTASYL